METMKPTPEATTEEKWPRKIRGVLSVDRDDSMEFRPQQTGEPQQEIIRKAGQSKLYRTTGKKEQKLVAHLVCSADAADPYAEMASQLERCAAVLQTRQPRRPVGAVLLHDGSIDVRHNRTKNELNVAFTIPLGDYPNYQKRFMEIMQRINQCFAINPISFQKPRK